MNETSEAQGQPAKPETFEIKDCALIAIATGNRAITLKEFYDILLTISPDSIYYHFWGGLLQPRFEEREYNNDFAAWAWYGLHDATLAERLAVVDPNEFASLESLRQELEEIVEERLDEKESLHGVYATEPFKFIRSQIVVFDTQKRAATPEELMVLMPSISTSSIFYHFIDARRRLPHRGDDFSFWLAGLASDRYKQLCQKLVTIDPYFGPLTQLKARLAALFVKYLAKETRP